MSREKGAGEVRRHLRTSAVFVIAIAVGVTFWVESQAASVSSDLTLVLGFAVAFFAARLLTIRLPQGDEICVTLMVGLVGLAFVDVPMLILASAIAGTTEAIARYSRSSKHQFESRIRDTLRSVTILALLSPWQLVLHPLVSSAGRAETTVLLAVAAGVVYAAVDVLTVATVHSAFGGESTIRNVSSLVRTLATVYVVHISMAAVVLRLQGVVGTWPFPVAILLTLILQNSFNLYIRIRRAYGETIGALAHAAELDRPHDSGHARRVADLSVTIGRRLGMTSHELERLSYAALLHDIGRMGAVGESPEGDHARRGAEIAASIPFLDGVSPLILWAPDDPSCAKSPPIGWSVVRTCSHYDRLRARVGADSALMAISREAPHGDRVIDALTDIVHSKRIIGEVSP